MNRDCVRRTLAKILSRRDRWLMMITVIALIISSTTAASNAVQGGWFSAWGVSMLRSPVPANAVRPLAQVAPRLHGQTLRQMVIVDVSGQRIRIRLSNTHGDKPVKIGASSVGRHVGDARGQLGASTLRALHFDGETSVTIQAGTVRYSDPVDLPVRAGDALGVNLYVAHETTPTTWHPDARRRNFISPPGNYTTSAVMPVATTTGAYLWLSGVEVQTKAPQSVLVVLGDSITNGFRSTPGTASSYPKVLARRLRNMHPPCHVAVINAGIDGNEISVRSGAYGQGESMVRRFDRDVLTRHGVRYVLLLGGINDIGETTMALRPSGATLDVKETVTNVLAAQQRIIDLAHAAGLHIIGATLPSFGGTLNAYSAAGERARTRINDWIRHRADFDGVVDFDAVLRDPEHPSRLRSDFDSGDHIHPNDKGYAAMAASVPPALLGCRD